MKGALLLAWRSTADSWGRSALLVAALGLAAGLPLAAGRALDGVQRSLRARAESTPLVVGPPGSPLDVVLRVTEFAATDAALPSIPQGALAVLGTEATVLPMAIGPRVAHAPVVGVPLEYLEWRGLSPAAGRQVALLGECTVGARVARAQDLAPGDKVTTTPDQVYSVAGSYPVRLHVVGVLAPTHTADDDAIFVSLETAWLIAGIGHGHQELGANAPVALLIRKDESSVTAGAAVREYLEVTPENAESFHFHGEPQSFPVQGAIVVPADARQAAVVRGRADKRADLLQVARPSEVIDQLFARVFHLRDLLAIVFGVVLAAAVLIAAALFALAVRMRAPQIRLLERVGATRGFVVRMLIVELLLVAAGALAVAALLVAAAPALEPFLKSQLA